MRRLIARVLSVIGVLGLLFVLSLSNTAWRQLVNSSPTLIVLSNIVGVLTSIGVFVPWLLGLYDWGAHFNGDAASRQRWGRVLIFALFIGGWLYWLARDPRRRASESS